jgi:hypothetical protein
MGDTLTIGLLLYDPATAARLLSVSRATLYKLLDPDPATGSNSQDLWMGVHATCC